MSSADPDSATKLATTPATTPAYAALTQRYRQLHHLEHLQGLAHWDQASHMPAGAAPARAQAMAELAGLMHRLRTESAVQGQLVQARQEPLSEAERANLREIERDWRLANALPDALVQRREIATAACEQAWRTQRPANDWAGFLPNFRAVVAVARDEADCLLDRHEPGMRCAQLDPLFADLRQWLPGLIQRVLAHQRATPVVPLQGPYPLEAQRALCERVMQLLQFNFDGGRLDISTHPFCGGAPEDVRLTNRYDLHDCLNGLLGAVHETGHGRYEQGRPRDWLGQPLSLARSMGIHESQSLA
ncbi:MAG: carboxypeptidase M32, partial [Burkholderiales bacterium PBB5]